MARVETSYFLRGKKFPFVRREVFGVSPVWKNNGEKLASLGIMGEQFRPPPHLTEIPLSSQYYRTEGFEGALNWVTIMPRSARLSNSYYSDIGFFFSLGYVKLRLYK